MEAPEPQLPTRIGRYAIVRPLGQGAMGRVLLAHDPVLDRDVAVKLLRDDLGLTAEQRQVLLDRMRQEARASARVSHPNIIALHDMGEDGELGLFLVFEYAEGTTLKERLGRGALSPETAATVALAMGEALATAHEAGVLHRDIKPENVILTKVGPKIADFGIARVPDSTLTRDGGLLGTPAYAAPEAIADGVFSPLSDQFSMAATLWEALSGRRAFPGDDAVAVASRIATEEPPKIAELCGLDPHVDTILARGLSKNPRGRFTDCREFGHALADELTPRGAMPTLPDRHHLRTVRRRTRGRTVSAGTLGLGVGIAIGAASLALLRPIPEPERPLPLVIPSSTPAEDEARPIGYLAELPAPKKKRPKRKKPKPDPVDAGVVDAATSDAAVDAGGHRDSTNEAGVDPPETP